MKAGQTYSISPPPMLVANTFLKGHSIRIEVSSSNFPTYARNLNTANDRYTSTETRIAHNQVLHGPGKLEDRAAGTTCHTVTCAETSR